MIIKEEVNVKETEPFKNEENKFQEDFKSSSTRQKIISKPEEHKRIIATVNSNTQPDNISQIEEQIQQNIVKNVDGTYSCKVCEKNSGRRIDNCRNHIETHLEGLSFNCPMCEKTFRSRHSLAMHKHRDHKN